MAKPLTYKLNLDHSFSPCSEEEAQTQFKNPETKRVAMSYLDDYRISTVFLTIDHGVNEVVLFETMVFSAGDEDVAEMDCYQQRYQTWDEAWEGHMTVCKRLAEQIKLGIESSLFEL